MSAPEPELDLVPAVGVAMSSCEGVSGAQFHVVAELRPDRH